MSTFLSPKMSTSGGRQKICILAQAAEYCDQILTLVASPQVAEARNMSISKHRHGSVTFKI